LLALWRARMASAEAVAVSAISRETPDNSSALHILLDRFGCPAICLSEPFEDGLALLRVAEKRGLEGVVSKRRDAPYRSGECRDWRKVKTAAWREANRERWRFFEQAK